MKNPYDIYNDNRAYHGYKRGVTEALDELVKRYDDYHNCLEDCPHLDEDITCVECVECIAKKIKDEI